MGRPLRSSWLLLPWRLCIVTAFCCWSLLFTGVLSAEEPSGEPPAKVQKPAEKGSKEQPPPAKPAESPRPKDQEERPTKKEEVPAQESSAKEPSKPPRTSLILTVKLALMATPQVFPYDIEVEQSDHQVTLTGKVASENEKMVATEVAKSVDGVASVHNKLEVVPELKQALAHKRDEVISQYVKERFAKSTTLKSANFDVKTENGIVTLGGVVRYQVIILEAAEAARLVPGVKAVRTDKVRVEDKE
ncbi:MAG TPA: BON domain-containing protein [Nitrospiraceae bacterium]|jgi:hyperosmotically inducible protein|nr:BON domain-containing protein [Nitrospiraceae bacterium]